MREGTSSFLPQSLTISLSFRWDGYTNQSSVIIDDLDKKHDYMGYHLKIWGDMYAFTAEVKGGTIMIRPKTIVVTSNYTPEQIWEDNNTLDPILRRYQVVHFPLPLPQVIPSPINLSFLNNLHQNDSF